MRRGRAVHREESMYKPRVVSGHRVQPFLLGWSRISLVYWLSNHSICSFEVGTTGWSPSRKTSDAASVFQWLLSTNDGQCSSRGLWWWAHLDFLTVYAPQPSCPRSLKHIYMRFAFISSALFLPPLLLGLMNPFFFFLPPSQGGRKLVIFVSFCFAFTQSVFPKAFICF